MSKKIFRSIWLAALVVLVLSLVLVMGVLYSYFTNVQQNQLRMGTEIVAQSVTMNGKNFFTSLNTEDYRITWIAADGTVLYDNENDAEQMENHLEREEVQQALESGTGESSRYSDTLASRSLYCARLLPDGTVIRLSAQQHSVWVLLVGFAQPICVILLLALALSFILAARLSDVIVEPINALNLDEPQKYVGQEEYSEIEPLLRRMALQQTQIRQDQEKLEKNSQIRQEFTANVSHELKTPLHAISGYAELMENGLVKQQDIRPFAHKIRQEALRLTALVEDIINLTRLDGGAAGMQRQSVDLYRIAENAVDSLQSEAAEADVTLTLRGESAVVDGIPPVLYSMIFNLCDNAIKYNRTGGSVKVQVSNYPEDIRITVADTGIGIPEESRERIFERFYRVDKSRSKEVGGTGLGLSIVKHAAMIHHAKIQMDSVTGKGTTFTVVFPKTEE